MFLPEVVVEPVWLDWVALEKRAVEEVAAVAAVQESCLKRMLELQSSAHQHWEHHGITAGLVAAEVLMLLLLLHLFLAVELQL